MDKKYHIKKVQRMLEVICPIDRLVVRSMPFGDLIDNDTRQAIDMTNPIILYGVVSAIKLAATVCDAD